jgi:hypothetical protein
MPALRVFAGSPLPNDHTLTVVVPWRYGYRVGGRARCDDELDPLVCGIEHRRHSFVPAARTKGRCRVAALNESGRDGGFIRIEERDVPA